MSPRLDIYKKTKKYVNKYKQGEIDADSLFQMTNWNIVCKSHIISEMPGAEGHQHRQNLRKTMWSCVKTAFPDLKSAQLPEDIAGNTFVKKRRK